MTRTNKMALLPVMLCFFAMGFVDLVGIASNYVKSDLGLSDASANIFPSLVFFWFLIFSVPTGMLMNKVGRKKTVLLSLIVTVVSLLLLRPDAGELLASRHRKCADADLPEPARGNGDAGRQPRLHADLRPVCQGHRLVHGPVHRHLGCQRYGALLRSGLESALPHLHDHRRAGHAAALSHADQGDSPSGQGLDLRRVLQAAGHSHRAVLLPRHHVPCGHRRRHEHDGPQAAHRAPGHDPQ